MAKRILIIKHGALGDIILATAPMKAIRAHHPDAHIVLLTTKAFAPLLAPCPFIDEIWIDEKPRAWQWGKLIRLIHAFNTPRFDWVYDLQTSGRSTRYFKLFLKPKPFFSGLARGASHRHHTPERTSLHTIDRQKQQLAIAGITDVPAPDVSWLGDALPLLFRHSVGRTASAQDLTEGDAAPDAHASSQHDRYVLFVPGGSAHRPEKRWPAEHYAELAKQLIDQGYRVALIGAGAEAELLSAIEKTCHPVGGNAAAQDPIEGDAAPDASASSQHDGAKIINLCNQTSFGQIAELARHAAYAVGNDTGPMHIIAATGCPCTVIFNITASNPDLCAPRGEKVCVVTSGSLEEVSVDGILSTIITT